LFIGSEFKPPVIFPARDGWSPDSASGPPLIALLISMPQQLLRLRTRLNDRAVCARPFSLWHFGITYQKNDSRRQLLAPISRKQACICLNLRQIPSHIDKKILLKYERSGLSRTNHLYFKNRI
jgi:hypothetical protein